MGATVTLVCGSVGVWQYGQAGPGHQGQTTANLFGAVYQALQMLVLHTPHFERGTNLWIEIGRWSGAFTLAGTTFLVFWQRLHREFRRLLHTGASDHYIVCGLGEKGASIIRSLKEKNPASPIVAIDPMPDPRRVDECDRLGVCVIAGDATRPETLAEANAPHAREIIVITPEDIVNVRIASAIGKLPVPAGRRTPGAGVPRPPLRHQSSRRASAPAPVAGGSGGGKPEFLRRF